MKKLNDAWKPKVSYPTHPGEILLEEFLKPMGITQTEFSQKIGCTFKTINQICRGKGAVTPTMALRLARNFKNSPEFWMNLQVAYDLFNSYVELKKSEQKTRVKKRSQPSNVA